MDLMDPMAMEFWTRLAASIFCGGIIGIERQIRGKPAGIRTSILVVVGTQMFVQLGVSVQGEHSDETRILGQVITGIGFLGAGVIIGRDGLVKGVTSAAVIWVLASIGSMIGTGRIPAAIAISLVCVIVLTFVELAEHSFAALRRGVHAIDSPANHAATHKSDRQRRGE